MKRVIGKNYGSVKLLFAVLVGVLLLSCQTFAAVKLNKTKAAINVGKKVQLKVSGASEVTWASSNKKIAAVSSSGVVTGKKAGTAKIVARVNSKKYACKVTVKNPAKLNKTKITLAAGKSIKLKVQKVSGTVKWASKNTKVAKVTSSGKVTGNKSGTTQITAVVYGKKLTCKVTVVNRTDPTDLIAAWNTSGNRLPEKSGNEYWNRNGYSRYLHSGQIEICPRHLYYKGNYFYAECFLINGGNTAVTDPYITQLQFSNSSGVFANAGFGTIGNNLKIPAHTYVIWTFRYPVRYCILNSDLSGYVAWNHSYRN